MEKQYGFGNKSSLLLKSAGILLFACLGLFLSCKENKPLGLFQKLDKGRTGIDFRNLILEKESFNIFKYQYFYNGGGVAVGDFNNDGLEDIVFTGNMVKNRLYLNKGNLRFEDATKTAGIAEKEGWCTGVTTIDINQDGWLDLYICRAGYPFEKFTRNLLFINNGKRDESGHVTFTEKAEDYGLNDAAHSTMASFFDYDRDGDLDMFLANHSEVEYSRGSLEVFQIRSKKKPEATNKLYRNDCTQTQKKFTDVTEEAGLFSNVLTFSLGLNISDINNDGWPDIFIGNDFNEPDYLFFNQKDGTFKDVIKTAFDHTAMFSMGADIADINNDGLVDIINLDMLPEGNYLQKMHSGADNYDKIAALIKNGFFKQYSRNMLQINNGDGTFSEYGQMAGVSNTDWSWSPLFLDFDNDGFKDLFISNGYLRDHTDMDFLRFTADEVQRINKGEENIGFEQYMAKMPSINQPNYFFRNDGGITFENMTEKWGLDIPSVSQGAAYADFDKDGDLDLVTNMSNEAAGFFENHLNEASDNTTHNYLQIKLIGSKQNPSAIGAKVRVYADGKCFFQEQQPVRGFQSTVSSILHFGLGTASNIDSIRTIWPDGKSTKTSKTLSNQLLKIDYTTASNGYFVERKLLKTPIFSKNQRLKLPSHSEHDGSDFHTQFLLPYFYSHQGPALATADLNGDGMVDFYLGAVEGKIGALHLSQKNGQYRSYSQPFEKLKLAEETAAVFFDTNGDGLKDLYIATGGYNQGPQKANTTDYLFINKGNGRFEHFETNTAKGIASCLAASDFDGDGDMDLFVGQSIQLGQFPNTHKSTLLLNQGNGQFKPWNFKPEGIVKDATWANIYGDSKPELIIAAEWAPIQVYSFEADTLKQIEGLFPEKSNGLYQSILAFDSDGDGDLDLLAGNFGTNNQLFASPEKPMELFAADFDKNGSIDPILCRYYGAQSYPIASREDMIGQLKYLAKKFISFDSYAKVDITEILSPNELTESKHGEVHLLETVLFINSGNSFSPKKLPQQVQVAPVIASLAFDADSDGNKDLVLAGNLSKARIKLGKLDGNHAQLLKADGQGNFEFMPYTESGFKVRGDVRALELFDGDKKELIFGINNEAMEIYSSN